MSHHNIEDFKPLSVSPNFGVLARPTYSAEATGETSPEPWIFTLRLLTENRLVSLVTSTNSRPNLFMDKPENEL